VGVVSWVYKRRRREIVYCKRSSLLFLYTAVWRRIHSQLINTMHAKMTLARWLRIYVWSYCAWNAIDFGIFLNDFVLLKELGLECSIYLEYYMDEQNKN
jgi:hypothetical protein